MAGNAKAVEARVEELEADDGEIGLILVEVELRAGGDIWLKDLGIDFIVEQNEVAPLGGKERAADRPGEGLLGPGFGGE
jgi:hypothetical protein